VKCDSTMLMLPCCSDPVLPSGVPHGFPHRFALLFYSGHSCRTKACTQMRRVRAEDRVPVCQKAGTSFSVCRKNKIINMPATELLYLSQLIFQEMDAGRHDKPSGGSPDGWLFIPGRSRGIMQIAYRLILYVHLNNYIAPEHSTRPGSR